MGADDDDSLPLRWSSNEGEKVTYGFALNRIRIFLYRVIILFEITTNVGRGSFEVIVVLEIALTDLLGKSGYVFAKMVTDAQLEVIKRLQRSGKRARRHAQ